MLKLSKSNFLFLPVIYFFVLFSVIETKGQDVINITNTTLSKPLGTQIDFFVDSASAFSDATITNCKSFEKGKISVPIFVLPRYNIWARLTVKNSIQEPDLFLALNYPYISDLFLYKKDSANKLQLLSHTGNATPFNTRPHDDINFVFPIKISPTEQQTYYFKVSSRHPTELSISVTNSGGLISTNFTQELIIGVYLGIISCMLLYNAFLFFSTKDKNYLLYVLYLFFLGFAQITFSGWSFKYLWASYPEINLYAVAGLSGIAGMLGVAFGKSFLNASHFTPKLNKVLSVLILLYAASVIFILFKQPFISYWILNINSSLVGISLLITSLTIIRKGYRPAYFYFFAWSFFCLG